jgi:trehalose 6-phosphate phosphatase
MHAWQHSEDNGLRAARTPVRWFENPAAQQQLGAVLRDAATPLLICDYDGTLAPFHSDKMQAYAYPGVAERLTRIAVGRTRLTFISGRPIAELLTLLPLAEHAEIWGMHGREHRTPQGDVTQYEPTAPQRAAFDHAQQDLEQKGFAGVLERKVGSLALHWRDASALPGDRDHAEQAARAAFAPFSGEHALALLPFDGGLELRTEDRTKEHAAEALLTIADPAAAAFLGDDVTDEDAFRAVDARGGTALLVRPELRPSAAHFALHPPDEWLFRFLASGHRHRVG